MTNDSAASSDARLRALAESVLATHGGRLDEAQRAILREHVERLRGLAAQLDEYHLENGDEPDSVFQVIDRVDAV
jgi:hypothetical protein